MKGVYGVMGEELRDVLVSGGDYGCRNRNRVAEEAALKKMARDDDFD